MTFMDLRFANLLYLLTYEIHILLLNEIASVSGEAMEGRGWGGENTTTILEHGNTFKKNASV